jgi:hypothetical protein
MGKSDNIYKIQINWFIILTLKYILVIYLFGKCIYLVL